MKNIFFSFLAIILFSLNGNAQSDDESGNEGIETAYISVKTGDELIKYKFSSIKDFEENTDKILDEISLRDSDKKQPCEVTVEISATVNTKGINTTLTSAVTARCSTVALLVKKHRGKLLATIRE